MKTRRKFRVTSVRRNWPWLQAHHHKRTKILLRVFIWRCLYLGYFLSYWLFLLSYHKLLDLLTVFFRYINIYNLWMVYFLTFLSGSPFYAVWQKFSLRFFHRVKMSILSYSVFSMISGIIVMLNNYIFCCYLSGFVVPWSLFQCYVWHGWVHLHFSYPLVCLCTYL